MASRANSILVVDDDQTVREAFAACLRRAGYPVKEAASAAEGLAVTRECLPSLVLLDVRLPDGNGLDLCRKIKGDPALANVFVALCSGEATAEGHKVDGFQTGADEYLVKPVGAEELVARVKTLLRLRDTAAALRASEEHYRRLVEILPDAICLVSPQGKLMSVNAQAAVLLGYDSAELLNKSIVDLIAPNHPLPVDLLVVKDQVVREVESTLRKKDGSLAQIELSATMAWGKDGKPVGLVCVARDITRRKRAEMELRRLPQRIIKAQEVERSRVARELHDGVNQIIAAVKMRLKSLQEGLPTFQAGTREILVRCDGLLSKSLEENRRIAHNLHPSDLSNLGLVTACQNLCQEFESRTGLRVVRQIDLPGKKRLPAGVELMLFRIVQEAMNNIAKYALAKTVRLQIACRDKMLTLSVQDDGLGFDTRKEARRKQGRGLGISNMRERALALGGTCEIQSSVGKGTTVTVRIPYQPGRRQNRLTENDLLI